MGMLLCVPMALVGLAAIVLALRGATRPRGRADAQAARRPTRRDDAALRRDPRRDPGRRGRSALDRYMALCLGHPVHGYYRTRDPLGARGDFITAPEISQMFGELIGLWIAADLGADGRARPASLLVELGPGRGTLMADALRALPGRAGPAARPPPRRDQPGPAGRAGSARSRRAPAADLARRRHRDAAAPGPTIVVANEFFDALPVRQFQRPDAAGASASSASAGGGALAFGLAAEPDTRIGATARAGGPR